MKKNSNNLVSELYKEEILQIFRNPINKSILEDYDYVAEAENTLCGDYLQIRIKCDKKDNITKVAFQGDGCAISQVSADKLVDYLKGKKFTILKKITEKKILGILGINVGHTRIKCATLCLKVVKKINK